MNSDNLFDLLLDCYEQAQSLLSCIGSDAAASLVHHPDAEIRAWAAKVLVMDTPDEAALDILLGLAEDADPSVRVEAVDSLSAYPCNASFDALKELLDDPDGMVRKYAIFGISDIGQFLRPVETANILKQMEAAESDPHVLAAVFQGRYLLGNDSCLEKLLHLFDTEDHQLQCTVLHILETVLSCRNAEYIGHFLDSINIAALPRSVSDSVIRLQNNWFFTEL